VLAIIAVFSWTHSSSSPRLLPPAQYFVKLARHSDPTIRAGVLARLCLSVCDFMYLLTLGNETNLFHLLARELYQKLVPIAFNGYLDLGAFHTFDQLQDLTAIK
jgi:hypothetical protein